jgi:hypothetical protein
VFCLLLCLLALCFVLSLLFPFPGSSDSRCALLEPLPPSPRPRPLCVGSVCKFCLRFGCFGWKLSFFFFFAAQASKKNFHGG